MYEIEFKTLMKIFLNVSFIFLSLLPVPVLIALIAFFTHKESWVHYFSICITGALIGFLASNSRISGVPELSAGILGIVSSIIIYNSLKNVEIERSRFQFLILLSFSISIFYGSIVGSYFRDQYEKYAEPTKNAFQKELEFRKQTEYRSLR